VDVLAGEPGVLDGALGDLGVELGGGLVGCVPGGMLENPGNVGLALYGQLFLRWRFFYPADFLACRGGLGKRRDIPPGERAMRSLTVKAPTPLPSGAAPAAG